MKKATALERFLQQREVPIPPEFAAQIERKHDHEGKGNPPVWLIWRVDKAVDGQPLFPTLDTVCDSRESAYYHVGMILDENRNRREGSTGHPVDVYVERIPANHRFGSSIPELQMKGYQTIRAFRKRHQLDGD